jgi:phthalate 4,5-cis-dihydrodiol dehydrogenase
VHALLASQHGKHALVEKPMAIALDDCAAMIAAARRAGVHLVVGHSHSFDAPILRTRELIMSGAYGAVRMITALNYTDFLRRPRRAEELDTAQGGGAVFNQAAHQVDIVRLLGAGRVRSVRAATGAWDASRPTEGAYSALLTFENGAFGSLIYSGYGHFDSDEFSGWIGEMGQAKPANARKLPPHFASAEEEAAFKNARNYGGAAYQPPANQDLAHQHFGTIIVSCERADLRPLPNGVAIYADGTARLDPLPLPSVPRAEVIDELYNAVVHSKPPLHDGAWAMATLEVCLAILQSAREGRDVALAHQIAC